MDDETTQWIEDRVNAIMKIAEFRPEIMPALTTYTKLCANSKEVPRQRQQQALMQPVTFAHDMLVRIASAVAFDEYHLDGGKYLEHDLVQRIREDIETEISIVADEEKSQGSGRAH